MARLLYGTGMRLMECLRLRVKDVDFVRREILIRDTKGGKDRVTVLPRTLETALRQQLQRARRLFDQDRLAGRSGVYLPHALERKYPNAGASWAWFWVFPAAGESVDWRSGVTRRHHAHEKSLQRAMKQAVGKGALPNPYRRIPCATRSPRICWNRATTFAPCRSYWVMRM
jgi:integrase